MNKLLFLIFIVPVTSLGQSVTFPTKADLENIYTKAIGDFIKAANTKNKSTFDTIFFGKHANGEPDDFPDIKLPSTIEHTHIKLISPQLSKKIQNEHKTRIYINLMGWVNKEAADFIFVVFSNGFAHQYDYHINYKYNTATKTFELNKVEYKSITQSK